MKRKKIEGFVYFARSGGPDRHIKIGFSKTPEVRLKALQTGSGYGVVPICVLPATTRHEAHLHKTLKNHRVIGEWFKDSPAVNEAANSALAGSWCGFVEDEGLSLSAYGEEALKLVSYIKSAAEYAGIWSLEKSKDVKIFGLSPWTIWKYFYRSVDVGFDEFESLLLSKKAAATFIVERAKEELADTDAKLEFLKREREEDVETISQLKDIEAKLSACFTSLGIDRPKYIPTQEEELEIRQEFDSHMARIDERRSNVLLAKIAKRKAA
jgi:T5orf172 domain